MNINKYVSYLVIPVDKDGYAVHGAYYRVTEDSSTYPEYFTRTAFPDVGTNYKLQLTGATVEDGEFIGGTWVEKEDVSTITTAANTTLCNINQAIKNYLFVIASNQINILQDAVDCDYATESEVALLKEWKKYRYTLGILDCKTSTNFPTPPKSVDGTEETYDSLLKCTTCE